MKKKFQRSFISLKPLVLNNSLYISILIGIILTTTLILVSFFSTFLFVPFSHIKSSFISYFTLYTPIRINNIFIIKGVIFIISFIFSYSTLNHLNLRTFIFKTLLILVYTTIFFTLDYLYLTSILTKKDILYLSLYFFIFFIIPVLLINTANGMLELLFSVFFKFKSFDIKNHDLYTTSTDYLLKLKMYEKQNINVYFLITTLLAPDKIEKKFSKLKKHLIRLFYFWYAYEYERVNLRFLLPLLAIIVSVVAFSINLYLLDSLNLNFESNTIKMVLATIFLVILYISMLYHLNRFLNPIYYLKNIDNLFKYYNIKFKDSNYRQKILLYLDKYFLINIYDKKYDRYFNLNSSKHFEKFILTAQIDKEGRNNIVNIFVSLFMIIYLTIFSVVLNQTKTDEIVSKKIINIKINNKEHNISIK